MDWLRKLLAQIVGLWGKWSLVQRIVLIGVTGIVIVGLAAMVSVSSAPTVVPVLDAPIRDEAALDRIVTRINQEGVDVTVNAAGVVQVQDRQTAQRMRSILIREDLIPSGMDPWAIFDRERWTITDFERNVNLRRAITQMVTDHIKALDDVDDANVTIVVPADRLFASEQNPVSASVIITPKPGSDISEPNRKKIQGIQKLLRLAIEGLKDENIVITDHTGMVLNDFAGMAETDRLANIERQSAIILKQEAQYRAKILSSLQQIFTPDRVRDLDIKIAMDMSQKTVSTEEFFPITRKPRTPGLSYDDSQLLDSVVRSQATSSTAWEGTGFNPEGPPGVEGQAPPAYKDMQNLYGKTTQETVQVNHEINRRQSQEERSPGIDRVTVSVNIDGTWEWKYDEKRNPLIAENGSIEREYKPVTPEDIRATQALIQNAIGYSAARGDSVTVHNIQFDRTREFRDEDAAYFRRKQLQTTIVVFLSGLAVLLIAFILFRTISREIERRRRLEAEERARREEALRQQALIQAEEEGVEVSMSVEERSRLELQESVANMAKEHPADVAQLIRTWLLED
ncbi:MAG: flagellar M-ring protein FliF [Treponema sp.]|jgi:flagellar M-ring protein FliF|nr:flagellar M-ring protein FliF [Treponema sp.]